MNEFKGFFKLSLPMQDSQLRLTYNIVYFTTDSIKFQLHFYQMKGFSFNPVFFNNDFVEYCKKYAMLQDQLDEPDFFPNFRLLDRKDIQTIEKLYEKKSHLGNIFVLID